MQNFLSFFYEFMIEFLNSVWGLFSNLWTNFWHIFDFRIYKGILDHYSPSFNAVGWILAILTIILVVAVLVIIIWLLFLLLRKYIRVRKTFIEKEDLVMQIDDLNKKVVKLIKEKDAIMAMKVATMGGFRGEDDDDGSTPAAGSEVSRFVKLIDVDKRYEAEPFVNPDPQDFTLKELCDIFRRFACTRLRLFYDISIVRKFFAGMGASRIMILEGISGTGKTSLPYAIGKFVKNSSPIIPVQPSWRDKTELIGYLNEFTKRFNETDFLRAIYEAKYRGDIMIIVLDEMNLARIEYYFAEILSLLEMPNKDEWQLDVTPDTWASDPKLLKKGKIQFPTNIWFVGTANNDDSTFTITDKVYDRSVPIPINTKGVPFEADPAEPMSVSSEYLDSLYAEAKRLHPISEELMDKFAQLDDFIINAFRMTFGNRILKQIREYVPCYVACGGTEIDGLDFMLCQKILRKLEGLNIAFEQDNLKKLILLIEKLYGKQNFNESKEYLKRLLRLK